MRRILSLPLVAVALWAAFGASNARADDPFSGKRWTLTQIGDQNWTAEKPYLEFDRAQGKVSGDAGCNRFSGTLEVKDSSLKVSRLISTKRACLDEAANRMESRFLGELERITRFEMRDGKLRLLADDLPSLVLSPAL